jgi:hypothetical protein
MLCRSNFKVEWGDRISGRHYTDMSRVMTAEKMIENDDRIKMLIPTHTFPYFKHVYPSSFYSVAAAAVAAIFTRAGPCRITCTNKKAAQEN